jgi:hypothetical protein
MRQWELHWWVIEITALVGFTRCILPELFYKTPLGIGGDFVKQDIGVDLVSGDVGVSFFLANSGLN